MNNTPKLRFKEFNDDLDLCTLEKKGEFLKGSILSKTDLSEDGRSCILYGQLYTHYNEVINNVYSKTNKEHKNLTIGKSNDVLIPSSGETAVDIATASCLQIDDVLIGGDLNIYRSDDINGVYLSYQLNSAKKNEISKLAQGASIVHLYSNSLARLKVNIPSLPEQEKIASFLSLFDQKIELQEEKVELLKEYKKGMMQKIFSQEIRFKDENGEDYPEWEVKKIKNISSIKTGKLNANAMVADGEYAFFTCSKEMFKTDKPAFEGDALIIAGNGDMGSVKYYSGKFNAYQRTYVLQDFKCNIMYARYFVEKYLPKRIYSNVNVGAMPYITLDVLANMNICIPNKQEQQKIADFLSIIDFKIELEQEKLSELKEYKKGLLQQMFV